MSNIKNILHYHFSNMFGHINHILADTYITKCVNEIKQLPPKIEKIYIKEPPVISYKIMDKQAGLYYETKTNTPCFVVAGGPSLKGFNFGLLKDKTTFVSNKTIFDVPDANYFITTDYTFLNYLKKMNSYTQWKQMVTEKYFVVNCISDVIQNVNGQIMDIRFGLKYELQDCDKIIVCKSAKDVGFDFANFNSGYNSGFSSFQLALIMGHNPIYLLGFDMNCDGTSTHYHQGYGKSYSKMQQNLLNYKNHFLHVLGKLNYERPDIDIISCSKNSSLNEVITYQNIEEIL